MGEPLCFARRISRHTASARPNINRNSQAKPNWVCESTIQIVPSAITLSNGLLAIRADNRHNHAKADTIDKARPIQKIFAARFRKTATAAPGRKSPIRKTGEATNKSKKTMPATITDETK